MRHALAILTLLAITLFAGCARKAKVAAGPAPIAYGTAIVLSSGDKQVASVGTILTQPIVVQVNDAQGNGVTGAPVWLSGPNGAQVEPAYAITDSSGQVTAAVTLGGMSGRYQISAYTKDSSGKRADLKIEEIALGYQQILGQQLNHQYCGRCHNPESTSERVSNFDNLTPAPHAFTDGDTLNKMSDQDLAAIIGHGGPALSKSAEMPPFAYTLTKSDIQALIAYIRAVSDPPYRPSGLVYAKNQ
jgi:mono/diheme cytochrome c family protein